jgi:mono/diheme cytochrome c family protein
VVSWLSGILLAGIGASAQAPAAATQSTAGNAQVGKDLYLRYSCYACHGYDGHGGAGARLVPMRMTGDRFTAYVRSPRTPQMPAYSTKLLTDAQLADVWAYIKSMPISPEAKDIPLLARIMSGK